MSAPQDRHRYTLHHANTLNCGGIRTRAVHSLRNKLVFVYEMLYGRPFVYVNDLFLDPEAQTLRSYTMAIGQFQQDKRLWGVNQDPKDSKESPL